MSKKRTAEDAVSVEPKKEKSDLKMCTSELKAAVYPRVQLEPKKLVNRLSYLKIITWNVNGFKALASKNVDTLHKLVLDNDPDMLFLQVFRSIYHLVSL